MSDDRDASTLRRLDAAKRRTADGIVGSAIGDEIAKLFHGQVEKRQTKTGQAAEAWAQLVPETLQRHSCVESLVRGRLTVVVDSAPHLFQLRQIMLAGLEAQLLSACRGAGVRRIALKRGRWYDDHGRDCF